MSDAPRDGRNIVLFAADGRNTLGYWRVTRRRDPKFLKWIDHWFWADPLNANQPIPFEPVRWEPEVFKALTDAPA